jgi:hypothetical protein
VTTDFSPPDHVVFTYRMAKSLTGVTARVQASTGLDTWSDTGTTPTIVSNEGSHYIMQSLVPKGSATILFLHLAVEMP